MNAKLVNKVLQSSAVSIDSQLMASKEFTPHTMTKDTQLKDNLKIDVEKVKTVNKSRNREATSSKPKESA